MPVLLLFDSVQQPLAANVDQCRDEGLRIRRNRPPFNPEPYCSQRSPGGLPGLLRRQEPPERLVHEVNAQGQGRHKIAPARQTVQDIGEMRTVERVRPSAVTCPQGVLGNAEAIHTAQHVVLHLRAQTRLEPQGLLDRIHDDTADRLAQLAVVARVG